MNQPGEGPPLALVGASGYVVNLATFALCVEALGFHYPVAATVAFLVAVTNNFWWNRHWTFRARGGFTASHRDFGFEPFTAAMGAIRNDEGLTFQLDVVGTAR